MEFLKKWWSQAQVFWAEMPFATRAMLAMVIVVLAVVVGVLVWLTGSPTMVPILPVPADRMAAVKARLEAANITVETRGTEILVPTDKQSEAMAILVQNDLLSGDNSEVWEEFIARQNPFRPNSQNAELYQLAKMKLLGQIISKMAGVHQADVVIDMPAQQGFGAAMALPTATVNVVMQSGEHMEKRLAEAIAGLVSGAVSGLKPQDVTIIDANLGRQFTVKSAEDSGGSDTMEQVQALEQYTHDKIAGLLSYIPGVIVAVNVRTDDVLKRVQETVGYEPTEPLSKEESDERERRTAGEGGAPGARSNVGQSLESAGNQNYEHETKTSTEYREKQITKKENTVFDGHELQKINVTVNVPRSYFVAVYKTSKTADASKGGDGTKTGENTEPDDATLKPVIDQQLAQIEEQVKPLVSAQDDGVVSVHMIPDAGPLMMGIGPSAQAAAAAPPLGALMESGWAAPLGIGALVVFVVVMIFMMTRWATRPPPMPTVEQLAGVPPVLPIDDDLIGEADAQDPTMAGVELDENQLRTRKIAEQIGEMVKTNPNEAATLFSRWIRKQD